MIGGADAIPGLEIRWHSGDWAVLRRLFELADDSPRQLDNTMQLGRVPRCPTAAAGVGNLRFYQLLGFRMLRVERDAFTVLAGYPEGLKIDGIPLRDRVWLSLALQGPRSSVSG
jgi:hypothetical protein